MDKVNDAWIVELTRDTVSQVDDLLRMSKSDFVTEFGCETDRVDKVKIEKAVVMLGTLKFFIDKTAQDSQPGKSPEPVRDGSGAKKQPLNG